MRRNRRWAALLLAGLLGAMLLWSGCGSPAGEPEPASQSNTAGDYQPAYQPQDSDPLLLWEVTLPEDNAKKLYLAGTIHIGPAEITALPAPLEEAFQTADILAVEVDLLAFQSDLQAQLDLSTKYGYYSGENETVRDHLSKETYAKARQVLKANGRDPTGMEALKVSQWSAVLTECAREKAGLRSEYGVDLYLLEKAQQSGKPIEEIESAEEQLKMNDSFSDALQELVLESSLDVDGSAAGQQQLYERWLAGDAEALAAQEADGQATEAQQKLLDEYYEKMLYSRSRRMAQKAEAYLKSGKTALFAVGAGHMGGARGIVALLEQDGCTVRQIARNGDFCGGEASAAA